MSWSRGLLAAFAVCALLPAGLAGCASDASHGQRDTASSPPAGRLLDDVDEDGHRYREVADTGDAPEIDVEVQPDPHDGWDLRLTLRNFNFSPAGTPSRAVAGQGLARLLVDGHAVAGLRAADYHLAARLVPRGTHHVTARLYADDGTVWAVGGEPVQSTADITASQAEATPTATP
ncbi:hypothetical protein ACIQU5_21655 [Streptomyces sp. NPDC090306]|uniref:hypothetical protein n=1 Tax=Streptomyces sp. NPDC090306 TaxID=3365961 RepID=UPI0037FA5AEC